MPDGLDWFRRLIPAQPKTAGLPPLSTTPLEQTNPGLAKIRDLVGGFIGTRDAMDPKSSGATLLGAAFGAGAPLLTGGLKLLPSAEQTAAKGITAYHGSPYKFDRFSLSKVGTGEGNTAYSHGLYFAENPAVATDYRNQLSDWQTLIGGKPVSSVQLEADPAKYAAHVVHQYERWGHSNPRRSAIWNLETQLNNKPSVIYDVNGVAQPHMPREREALALLQSDAPLPKVERKSTGKIYEVNLNAEPDDFLNWDKPLSEQSQKVKDALQRAGFAHPEKHADLTGSQLHSRAAAMIGMADTQADTERLVSEVLKESGIKGVKYLDQMSRTGSLNISSLEAQVADAKAAYQSIKDRLRQPVSTRMMPTIHADLKQAEFRLNNAESTLEAALRQPPPTHNYVVYDEDIIAIQKQYGVTVPQAIAIQQAMQQRDSKKSQAMNTVLNRPQSLGGVSIAPPMASHAR